MEFGLIVIGDEILSGRRQDRHFEYFRTLLASHGHSLAWLQILPDEPDLLEARFRQSMAEGRPVFCCGGIGATPDDYTRQVAARAAGVPLVRHPEAVAEIEARFGETAYPVRILMADLAQGANLIPNPVNRVPGFSIREHHFLPGFPQMAHPMAAWVLERYYPDGPGVTTRALRVHGVAESDVMDLLQELDQRHRVARLFSLPRIDEGRSIELGFKGPAVEVEVAFDDMLAQLRQRGISLELL